MPFRFSLRQLVDCEVALDFKFPDVYRRWMVSGGGIELEVDGCSWFLHAIERADGGTASDVVAATRVARSLEGWPDGAVSIGWDGGGGRLFLNRRASGVYELGFWGGRYGQGCVRSSPVESAFPALSTDSDEPVS